jgi:hypothetical protein
MKAIAREDDPEIDILKDFSKSALSSDAVMYAFTLEAPSGPPQDESVTTAGLTSSLSPEPGR